MGHIQLGLPVVGIASSLGLPMVETANGWDGQWLGWPMTWDCQWLGWPVVGMANGLGLPSGWFHGSSPTAAPPAGTSGAGKEVEMDLLRWPKPCPLHSIRHRRHWAQGQLWGLGPLSWGKEA